MGATKQRAYYRALRRLAALVNSDKELKEVMMAIVRGIARAMAASASLVLLNSSGKKLVHTYSWGLPDYYVRKGLVDADKSLTEVIMKQPVAIADAGCDSRTHRADTIKPLEIYLYLDSDKQNSKKTRKNRVLTMLILGLLFCLKHNKIRVSVDLVS